MRKRISLLLVLCLLFTGVYIPPVNALDYVVGETIDLGSGWDRWVSSNGQVKVESMVVNDNYAVFYTLYNESAYMHTYNRMTGQHYYQGLSWDFENMFYPGLYFINDSEVLVFCGYNPFNSDRTYLGSYNFKTNSFTEWGTASSRSRPSFYEPSQNILYSYYPYNSSQLLKELDYDAGDRSLMSVHSFSGSSNNGLIYDVETSKYYEIQSYSSGFRIYQINDDWSKSLYYSTGRLTTYGVIMKTFKMRDYYIGLTQSDEIFQFSIKDKTAKKLFNVVDYRDVYVDDSGIYVFDRTDGYEIDVYKPNTPPVITGYAPNGGEYHISDAVPVSFTDGDVDGQSLSRTLSIGSSLGGAQYFSGNTNSTSFNPSSVGLAWNGSANRYEGTLYIRGTTSDGYETVQQDWTTTVYNERPSYNHAWASMADNYSQGQSITFTFKVWDAGGGPIDVGASFAGQTKSVTVAERLSQPAADNVSISFDLDALGSYTNPTFTITDEWGAAQSFTLNYTANVTDFLGELKAYVSDKVDFTEQDVMCVVSIEDVSISNTIENQTKLSDIKAMVENRNAGSYHFGRSSNESLFTNAYSSNFDATNNTDGLRVYINNLVDGLSLNTAVFDIGKDHINYNFLFEDMDHDYKGLDVTGRSQAVVDDADKEANEIYVQFEHDAQAFDDPGVQSAKHMNSFIQIADFSDLRLPQEAKAEYWGIWDITAYASDLVEGNETFNKDSLNEVKQMIIQYAPTAEITLNDNADWTTFHVSARNSSDPEFYQSLTNNGIFTPTWKIKAGGMWYDVAFNVFEADLPYSYGGEDVTAVMLTVYDVYGSSGVDYEEVNANLKARLTVNKPAPYELKTGESFTATLEINTVETIQEPVTCEVVGWAGSQKVMSFVSKTGNVSTYQASYTVQGTAADGLYDVKGLVNTVEGSTATRYAEILVMNNKPPVIDIVDTDPTFVYEGDRVTALIEVDDEDLQTLSVHVTCTDQVSGDVLQDIIVSVDPVGGVYPPLEVGLTDSIPLSDYLIEASATDPYGASDQDSHAFSTNELGIEGRVYHTDKWEANRQAYNAKKTSLGETHLIRSTDVFWPGEKFMLEATTTVIDPASSVTADAVTCEILTEPYSTTLMNTSGVTWNGSLWNAAFERFIHGRVLTFRFRVEYSNGAIKEDEETITIDKSQDYYQYHQQF